MAKYTLLAVLAVLAAVPAAPAQRHYVDPGLGLPASTNYTLAVETLRSGLDWRRREEAAELLGGSGDPRYLDILSAAAANDPSGRVRRAAADAIDSIREAAGGRPTLRPPALPSPWVPPPIPADPYAEMVESWYAQYMHRSADPAAVANYAALLRRGVPPEEVQANMLGSAEYFLVHGRSAEGFVRGLYNDVLQREPRGGEVRTWVQRLAVDRGNREVLAREFLEAAQHELNSRPVLYRNLP
jgi:HEAT repeats/Domain of unknown function (DUF4214)